MSRLVRTKSASSSDDSPVTMDAFNELVAFRQKERDLESSSNDDDDNDDDNEEVKLILEGRFRQSAEDDDRAQKISQTRNMMSTNNNNVLTTEETMISQSVSPKSMSPKSVSPKNVSPAGEHRKLELKPNVIAMLNSDDEMLRMKTIFWVENYILSNRAKCQYRNKVHEQLFQLHPSKLIEYMLEDGKFDHQAQLNMSCLADSIISHETSVVSTFRAEWLHKFINVMNQISDSSSEKIDNQQLLEISMKLLTQPYLESMTDSLSKDVKLIVSGRNNLMQILSSSIPIFTIKAASDKNHDNGIHEAFIGIEALNNMRKYLPTFMHIYGYFKCLPPTFRPNGETISFCSRVSGTDDVNYLMIEYIDGKQLDGLLNRINSAIFLEIFWQIVSAIYLAHRMYDFTHYDLHTSNVLITILPNEILIPCYTPVIDDRKYIKTRFLARIVDYGYSHIKYDDIHFGVQDLTQYCVYGNRSLPLFDLYKLICFSAESIERYHINKNMTDKKYNDLHETIDKIYGFFNTDDVTERVKLRVTNPNSDFYQLPANFLTVNMTEVMDDFAKHLISNVGDSCLVPYDTSMKLAVCNENCVTWSDFVNTVFDPAIPIDNIRQLNIAYHAAQKIPNNEQVLKSLIEYPIDQYFYNEFNNIKRILNMLRVQSGRLSKIDPYYAEFIQLFDTARNWISAAIDVYNRRGKIREIYDQISSLFPDLKAIDEYVNNVRT